ncbi:MAG: hypothetical protein ACK40D_02695 [Cyanobacteriota bacterium]
MRELPALGQLRTRQRAPRHIVDAAILEVCRGHHLTPQQIARAIGRHYDTVRGRYLPDLVAAGKLEPLHPNAKHHPSKAYQGCRAFEAKGAAGVAHHTTRHHSTLSRKQRALR